MSNKKVNKKEVLYWFILIVFTIFCTIYVVWGPEALIKSISFLFFLTILSILFTILKYGGLNTEKKLKEYCKQNSITYKEQAKTMSGHNEKFKVFDHFWGANVMREMSGTRNNIEFCIADYEYPSGKNTITYTICKLYKPNIKLPYFYIRDNDKIENALNYLFGEKRIVFANHKDFTDKFYLQGDGKSKLGEFFIEEVREAFFNNHKYGYFYEGKGNCFLLYIGGVAYINKRIEMLDTAFRIFEAITPDNSYFADYNNSSKKTIDNNTPKAKKKKKKNKNKKKS